MEQTCDVLTQFLAQFLATLPCFRNALESWLARACADYAPGDLADLSRSPCVVESITDAPPALDRLVYRGGGHVWA